MRNIPFLTFITRRRLHRLAILPLLLCILYSFHINAQQLQVRVTGIKSEKGKIILSVFKDNPSFEDEKPMKKFSFSKNGLTNGSLTVHCQLTAGTYGFTLIDDENDNGELERNLVGVPKEGFGFSNFYLTKLKKPAFDEFKFDLPSSGATIYIKAKYM